MVVNVLLCWLFVMVARWGVSGAALATVAGQAVSAGMGLWHFFVRPRAVPVAPWLRRPDRLLLREVVLTGLPSFTRNAGASGLIVVTNHLLRDAGGDAALGVFAVVSRLLAALLTPQTGVAQGAQPLVAFAVGRSEWGRARATVAWGLGATVTYGLIVCAACWLWPSAWLSLLSHDDRVQRDGAQALRLLSLAAPCLGVNVLAVAALQAAGRVRPALLLSVGGPLLKVPVLMIGAQRSLTGLWVADAASEALLAGGAAWFLWRLHRQRTTPAAGPD